MPPNNKEIAIKLNYNNQDALPFNQPEYERKAGNIEAKVNDGSHPQPGTRQNNDVEINEEASGLRITTRARHTYELDRYSKNAMLIINNKNPLKEADDTAQTLADTFAKYRFEVEILDNCSRDRIISTCEKFFTRDFTEYGSVAVATLTLEDAYGNFMADDGSYKKSDILKFMTSHLPVTLRNKPKIYITETNRFIRQQSWMFTDNDFLIFDIPVSFLSPNTSLTTLSSTEPLHTLCRNIIQTGDLEDLMTIMVKSIQDIINFNDTTIFVNHPINVASTLTKELRLMKSI